MYTCKPRTIILGVKRTPDVGMMPPFQKARQSSLLREEAGDPVFAGGARLGFSENNNRHY